MESKKILISFLGTGEGNRDYAPVKYGSSTEKEKFFYQYLDKKESFDKIYMLGTVKSIWERIYDNSQKDVQNYCTRQGYKTDIDQKPLPCKEDIEKEINGKVVLLKYGITSEEIVYNTRKILEIEDDFKDNIEYHLYVDITHGFRSIPMVLLNTIVYLQNVSKMHIKIESIFYGMREVEKEMRYVPVVDLKEILNINDWIVAAYAFKEFGNTKKIVGYKNDAGKEISGLLKNCDSLKKYSDVLNLNYVAKTEDAIMELCDFNEALSDEYAKLTIGNVTKDVVDQLTENQKDCKQTPLAIQQLNIAKMQFDNMNYSNSYLSMQESIISYVCEINGFDKKQNKSFDKKVDQNKLDRADAVKWLELNTSKSISKYYKELKDYRNIIAHSIEKNVDVASMINLLKSNLEEIREIYKTQTLK